MSKIQNELTGDFNKILQDLDHSVLDNSFSASREDQSDFLTDNCKCAVRVYERYSMLGKNRVSLHLTLLETDNRIFISAITLGGSQAVLFKINTFGEDSFLYSIKGVIDKYKTPTK